MSIKIHLLPENHDPDLHQVTSDSVIFIAVMYDIGQLTKTHFLLGNTSICSYDRPCTY